MEVDDPEAAGADEVAPGPEPMDVDEPPPVAALPAPAAVAPAVPLAPPVPAPEAAPAGGSSLVQGCGCALPWVADARKEDDDSDNSPLVPRKSCAPPKDPPGGGPPGDDDSDARARRVLRGLMAKAKSKSARSPNPSPPASKGDGGGRRKAPRGRAVHYNKQRMMNLALKRMSLQQFERTSRALRLKEGRHCTRVVNIANRVSPHVRARLMKRWPTPAMQRREALTVLHMSTCEPGEYRPPQPSNHRAPVHRLELSVHPVDLTVRPPPAQIFRE